VARSIMAPFSKFAKEGDSTGWETPMSGMKRRHFITLLGGAAAAWPLAARAQQPDRIRRVGLLLNMTKDDSEWQVRLAALQQGLLALGWIENRTAFGRWRRNSLVWHRTSSSRTRRR
jgi:hypothetical protein